MSKEQERAAAGIKIVAAAVLAAPAASEIEKDLARRVLGATEAAELVRRHKAPREAATIADTFNRQLDALIDAVDSTRGADERPLRRARLAPLLDRAGLCFLERDELVRVFGLECELKLAVDRVAELEAERDDEDLSFGAECLEDGGDRFGQDPGLND